MIRNVLVGYSLLFSLPFKTYFFDFWLCHPYILYIQHFIYGLENCLVSALVCNASGDSDVTIECEHVTTQTPANCSFNGGPYHPCEDAFSIHFAYLPYWYVQYLLCLSYGTGTLPLILNSDVSPSGEHSVAIVANNDIDNVLVSYRINETLKPAGKYAL